MPQPVPLAGLNLTSWNTRQVCINLSVRNGRDCDAHSPRPPRGACACVASAVLLASAGGYAMATTAAVPRPGPGFVALNDSVGASTAGRTGAYTGARMTVELTLAPRDPAGLASALRSAYTVGSPGYHRWLKTGQFDARYAPSVSVRAAVAAYLRSAGLTVAGSSSPFLVRAAGSSRQVESAFRTSLSSYRDAEGVRYFANSMAVWLPAGIARDVLGVVGLTNTVRLRSMLMRPYGSPQPAGGHASAVCDSSYPTAAQLFSELSSGQQVYPVVGYGAGPGCSGLTPSQINSIYGAPHAGPHGEGAGVTIGLFELSAYQPSDPSTWARYFYGPGYHPPHLVNISVDGGPLNPACPAGDQCPADYNGYSGDIEVDGDIEMDLAVAPDARQIEVYNAPGDTTGQTSLDEYAAIANQNTADVVSASWATCENDLSAGYVQAENEIFEQMALQGQSMFSGSGDTGPFGCVASDGTTVQNVMDPSAQPWVTGTGSTSLESYQVAGVPAFRPVVKAAGPRPASGRAVLLLDVLAQDRDGGAAGGSGEVGRGPQMVCPPVVAAQVRELLPHAAGGHALEGVHEPGQRHLGRKFTSRRT
jgi:subtilase family serine protease